MSMQIITVADRIPEQPYYKFKEFLASARVFGVEPVVLGMGQGWRGLMTKPFLLREYLRSGACDAERLIVCDAFDVVFSEHPHALSARAEKLHGDAIVFNGEKAVWPRADLAHLFEGGLGLNSGVMFGPTQRILALLEAMDIERIGFDPPAPGPYPNDQGEYQALYGTQPVPMVVDSKCELAQCLFGCEYSEFDWEDPIGLRNIATGTYPGVWHCNGGSKEVFQPRLFARLGLD